MTATHVKGKKKALVMLYALSTCGWCRKTKHLLNELGVEYDCADVDLLKGAEKEKVMKELERWNPRFSFPTVVIDGRAIIGFDENGIKKAVGDE